MGSRRLSKGARIILLLAGLGGAGAFLYWLWIMPPHPPAAGPDIPWEDPDFQYWRGAMGDTAIVCWNRGDLNDDGRLETVVVYARCAEDSGSYQPQPALDEKRFMQVIIPDGSAYRLSPAFRAPVDDQRIEFKDIDREKPMEFIISGHKGGNVGYAVYRMENGEVVDLFGDGMDGCC